MKSTINKQFQHYKRVILKVVFSLNNIIYYVHDIFQYSLDISFYIFHEQFLYYFDMII